MRFGVLGPLQAWNGEEELPLRGATPRAVLALLLVHANQIVLVEQIVESLWDEPPETAPKMVQNAVSRLRKLPGVGDHLVTRFGGYALSVEPTELDATEFEGLVRDAQMALGGGRAADGVAIVERAEALWRGPPYLEVSDERFAQPAIARLEDLRKEAIECRIDAQLALGQGAELVAELEGLVAAYPLREKLRGQLMLALYRAGRQAEALAAFRDARRHLLDELGIAPGPALQRLERAILQQEASLEPAAPEAARRPVRKAVTVVYALLERAGERLDPEAAGRVTARVRERLTAAIAAHGGQAELEPTGALLAVFGLPALAEDDAVRGARAAAALPAALVPLNEELERDWRVSVSARIGLCTGDVLVGDDGSLTGDVAAESARLARSAAPGEVLLSAATGRSLGAGVLTETAGGEALRLLEIAPDGESLPRSVDAPFVGREWELGQLQSAFDRTVRGRSSFLVSVLGPGGIGKSRLVHEFLRSAREEATVLTSRCLSSGVGITFWPLLELVRAAATGTSSEAVAAVVEDDDDAEQIAAQIAGAIGTGAPAGSAAELFWATRRLFTALAQKRPLVLVIDDLHWAEPMLLDLLDAVVEGARDAPVLLVCLARPELLDVRPGWGGGKVNATSLLLDPLTPEECELVIENAGGSALTSGTTARIAEAAEGNPLFLEQMVVLALEEPPAAGALAVPPTIQALLATRLDRLDPEERAVLERAAVVGREFRLDEVIELSPPAARAGVPERLEGLLRRELIGRTPTARADGYRFRHALIREAAYDGLPKLERAALHALFGRLLPTAAPAELRGYHLEQSYLHRSALEPPDAAARALALDASSLLAEAGRRAYARDDVGAAVALLTRAAALLEDGDADRLALLPELGEAVRESGDYARGEAVLGEAVDAATRAGDPALEAYARLIRVRMRVQTDPTLSADDLLTEADHAIAVFDPLGDDRRLAKAWELLAWARWLRCQAAATEEALARSLAHARRGRDSRTEAQSLHLLLGATLFGPVPVAEGIDRCETILGDRSGQPRVTASALRALAALKAMRGEVDEARSLMEYFGTIVDDLGLRVTAASAAETSGLVELLAGDPEAAERLLRRGYAQLEEMGERSTSANLAALLAQALYAQGRYADAVAVTETAPAPADVSARVHLGAARSKALARVGRTDEAELTGRQAAQLAASTDFIVMHADALVDLASALQDPGGAEPEALVRKAIGLYECKGNVVSAAAALALAPSTRAAG